MDKLEILRKEIERLMEWQEPIISDSISFNAGHNAALNKILSLIDSMQEDPKKCMYSKDNYTDEDRKVLCEDCQEECEYAKKKVPVSEDLEKKLKDYVCHEWAGDPIVLVRHFANWQKERLLSKACEYLKDNIWRNLYFVNGEAGFPTAEFIKGFRKAMEE